jgi:uncharacterized membrane protein
MEFPPLPSWDGLHPLIIHFPIALLLVAPLLVVLGALAGKRGKGMLMAALILMVLGTAFSYVAVETGEAAAELADRTPQMAPVLAHHQKLAERTRLMFTVLTLLFAAITLGPALLKRDMKRPLALALYACFLALYAVGAITLANTAHNGGRLVHEFGVRALMPATPPAASEAPHT